jgi:hypothetical protein
MGEQEQFQQPDPLQKMYGVLTQKGYYTKSFDEFKQKYSQPENIDKLYSVLNRDGLYTKNKDSFYGKYFPALPAKPNGEPKPESISAPFLINKNTFAIPEGGFKGTQEELLSHVKTSPKINYPDQQAPKESKDPVGDFMAEQNEKKRQSLSRATDNTSIARSLPQEPLTPKVEDVKKTAFQSTDDAADWLSKNKKIELDPALLYQYDRATLHKAAGDNKTSQVAADKVYEAGRLKQAIETSPDLETVAAKYGAAIGEIKDPATVQAIQTGSSTWKGILDDATKGQLLNTLFHSSDFVNEVRKNPALYQQYKQESVNLMQHYPEFGTGIIASVISQAREDKGKNNWFVNVKSKEDTDKMVDELVAEGKLSAMDKTFYQQHRDDVFYKIKSPGIIEEGLGGIRDFAEGAVKSYKALESKGTGLLTGWMGQERNHDTELAAEELSKRSSESGFQPKGVHKFSMIGGQMVGYLLPIGALAKGLTASQLVNNPMLANGLSFGMEEFGNVEGRAREYFPNDKTKQFAYTSLLTLLNTSIGGVLPQGKAAEALSKIEPTAVEVLNKFTAGEISSAAAKDLLRTQVQKVLVQAGDIAGATLKHNVKAANVMSALEMADRGLVNLFDGQDPHEKMNAGHVFENWLTNAIASTGLSAIAAVPEGSAKRIKAKQLFEMATNYDKYNSILDRQVLLQPELAAEIKDKKQNLQLAAGIVNDIANTELTQAQKEKYLLHSLNEQMLTKKLEGMTDGLLKKQTREQIKKSEEAREKLFEDRKNQLNEQQKAAIDKQFEEIQNEKTKENVTTDQPTGIPTAEAGNKEVEQAGVGETNTGLQTDNGRSGENVGTEIKLEAPVESKVGEDYTGVAYHGDTGKEDRSNRIYLGDESLATDYGDGKVEKYEYKLRKPFVVATDADFAPIKKLIDKYTDANPEAKWHPDTTEYVNKELEKQGYDGLVIKKEAIDTEKGYEEIGGTYGDPQVVVFDRKNVKKVAEPEIKVGDAVDTPHGKATISRINKNGVPFAKTENGMEIMYTPKLWGGQKEATQAESGANQEVKTVEDAIKKHDSIENYTFQDMVSDIEHIANESGDAKLLKAVEDYRKAQEYDNKVSGRGDMDAAEKAFEAAIRPEVKNENSIPDTHKTLVEQLKKATLSNSKGSSKQTQVIEVPVSDYLYGHDADAVEPITEKRKITEPIDIYVEDLNNPYLEVYDGNHRLAQARFNGDKTIKARIRMPKDVAEQLQSEKPNSEQVVQESVQEPSQRVFDNTGVELKKIKAAPSEIMHFNQGNGKFGKVTLVVDESVKSNYKKQSAATGYNDERTTASNHILKQVAKELRKEYVDVIVDLRGIDLKQPIEKILEQVSLKKPNQGEVVQGSDTTQAPTENPKPESKTPHADFREQILSDLENEKGSEFDFVLDELPIQQSGRKTAVKNIRQGKSTKATKMVEEAIQKMYDEGYVYLNRGRGNQSERIAIPLEKYMEEIRRPLEATEADLHELNTLLGDEAFNDTFDRAYEEITKTQNNETKRNGEIAETPATPEGAAEPSVSETKAGKSGSQPDTENTIGNGEGGQPPTTKEQAAEVGGGEGQGIRHADTAETRKEFGLPDYEKKTDTIEAWDAEADQRIANGEMGSVIEKMQKGEQPSAVETRMMGKYIATLADKADKAPIKENLVALRDAIELSDRVGGSDVGKALRARQGDFLPDDSLSGNLVKRMEAAGVTELTEAQKKEVETLTNELKRTKEEAQQKLDELEQKNKELQAELEIANAKKTAKKNEKKDYKKERSDIKQSIKDKWKKAANDGTLTAVPVPYAKQLASIAPDVAKLMKSYVEEGVTTLVELVDRIHGDVKEAIPEIDRKDVFDILAGKYNEPKKTKNELMEQMRDLRDEAKYIDQLETLNAGMEPKSERAKVERNRRVKELQEKIKEHDVTKLSQIKKRNEAQLEKIKEQLRTGDFEKKKTVSAIDNLELQKKYPELYKSTLNAIRARENAKHQLDLANLNEEMKAQGFGKKASGHLARAFRTAKALKAGIDDSGLGVQVLLLGLANPRSFASALKEHALDALSAERFERNLAKLHNSEWWPLIEQSGLSVVDPKSLRESEKNDIYNDTYWDKMQVKRADGTTINLAPTKPFERAFTSLGNNIRVNIFLKRADVMMDKGITINNHPEEYKALASVVNNLSGRGTMAKKIEVHNDILSAVLWSPRLLASSVNVLGLSDATMFFAGEKGFYRSLTPMQKRYVAGQLVRGIGTGVALMAALSYSLGGDSDLDPTSVTFGTVKVGDYRYTIFGRYTSIVRMIAMSALATRKTSKGTDDLTDKKGSTLDAEGGKFIRGKVNPTLGILWDVWSRKGYDGKPVTPLSEAKNALLPMSVDDVLKGLSQDGTKSLLIRGIPSFIGVKVSNENDFQQSGGAAPKKKPSKPTPKHKTRD